MTEELLTKYLEGTTGGTSGFFRAVDPGQLELSRLTDIKGRLGEEGLTLVISHYGTLANAVDGDRELSSPEIVVEGVKIVHQGLRMLHQAIAVNGGDVSKFTPQEVVEIGRSLAVMTYLVSRCLSGLETKSVQQRLGVVGRGRHQFAINGGGNNQWHNWRDLRTTLIEDLLRILKLPVEKIWDDSGYGFSVPRLLIRSMCSTFSEASIAEEAVAQGNDAAMIFSILAKRFGKTQDIFQQLFPLMKYGEEVGQLISQTVARMVADDIPNTVLNVFVAARTVLEDVGKPATADKGAAVCVLGVCERNPKEVMIEGYMVYPTLLEIDSPVVRNAAVQGCGLILRKMEGTDEATKRKYRSVLFDGILIAHCMDVNILVRSKCLQVLSKLVEDMLLDPLEVSLCFTVAIARLLDNGATSRKYALLLVKNVLSKFPGICRMDINYKDEIDSQRRTLLELMAKSAPKKSYSNITREFINQSQIQEFPLPSEFLSDLEEGMDKVRPLIARLLDEERCWDACIVFYHVLNTYARDVGITDAANKAAASRPTIYLDYFKRLEESNGHDVSDSSTSDLDESTDLSESMTHDLLQESEEIVRQRKSLHFSQASLQMKLKLDLLVEKLLGLLQMSLGNKGERDEVIEVVKLMEVNGYPRTARISTPLIQTIATQDVKFATKSFWNIFIGEGDRTNGEIVASLFKTLGSVNAATRDLLKPIIAEMHASRSLSVAAVNIVWAAFTRSSDRWTLNDSKNAVFLIGAISKNDRQTLSANFELLMKHGLSEKVVEDDLELVRYILEAILYAFRTVKKDESDVLTTERLPENHPLWNRAVEILEYGLLKKGNWDMHLHFPMVAELAVQIIYHLSWDYSPHVKRLLSVISKVVFGSNEAPSSEIASSEEIYIRYFAIMTAILGAHVNYYETIVIPEIKRRKAVGLDGDRTEQPSVLSTASRASVGPNASNPRLSSLSMSSKRSARPNGRESNVSVAQSDVTELMSATLATGYGYDPEIEIVKIYVEKLLDSGTFLQFRRLTLSFCRKITAMKDYKLQLAVVKALAKLMLVSAESVNKLAEHFMALWSNVKDTRVKVEILKHLAVLNIQFPNQVEQCNSIIKEGLLGANIDVKTACLDVLGHLALGDIVKVRHNIPDVAVCLCSDNGVIRGLAKDFFQVICAGNKEENAITNAIPDVISTLSNRTDVTPDQFKTIMTFLLTRVKKERQIVGLVSTLVKKLKAKGRRETRRICEDIAHCLTLLPHSEKTFKILRENLKNYADKLEFESVYHSFETIVDVLSKTIQKEETKALLEDFATDLEGHRERLVENQRIADAKSRHEEKRGRSELGNGLREEEEDVSTSTSSSSSSSNDSNAENQDPGSLQVSNITTSTNGDAEEESETDESDSSDIDLLFESD